MASATPKMPLPPPAYLDTARSEPKGDSACLNAVRSHAPCCHVTEGKFMNNIVGVKAMWWLTFA